LTNLPDRPLALDTLFCGRTHLQLDAVDSTNSELLRRMKNETLPEGFLVTATHQTSGRGYAGNRWQDEPGQNVLMSLLLRPTFMTARRQFYLTQALSLAVHDAFAARLKKHAFKIKWPNDLVCNGKKICGMLVENAVSGDAMQHAVCGIGFNLNRTSFPKGINATSYKLESGKETDIHQAVAALCAAIEARYLQLRNGKIEQLQVDYMKRLYRLETFEDYRIFGKPMQGKIVGLNPEGKLVLDTEDGFQVCAFKEIEYV
jgi:BirA family transcriptional regulator, biotin operon repressor / biotin---[acetyl-CoA-carboxylase] ligase